MCIRCELDELLKVFCECENYFQCEWHKLIKEEGEQAAVVAMRDELDYRHYLWAVEHGLVDPI